MPQNPQGSPVRSPYLDPEQHSIAHTFKTEISDHSHKVDPEDLCDWNDLAFGFALGKGLSIEKALAVTSYIRYHLCS